MCSEWRVCSETSWRPTLHFSIISDVEHFFIWLAFEYLFSWSVSLNFCSFLYWIFFFLLLCRHSLYIILISLGSHNKVLQTGWLKQQKSIVSQFWRLAVWDQGVGSIGSCWRLGEKNLFHNFLPVSGGLLASFGNSLACSSLISSHGVLPVYMSPYPNFSFYKDTSHIGLVTHSNMISS